MTYREKILFIDNDPMDADTYVDFLRSYGEYNVSIATTLDSARQKLKEWHHIAIVDKRMIDNSDDEDSSGIDLIKESDSIIPKIVLTIDNDVKTVRDAWAVGVAKFLAKGELLEHGFSPLLEAVEKVFEEDCKINRTLELKFGGTSLLCMVSLLENVPTEPIKLVARAEELGDLFRKLFLNCSEVTIFPLLYSGRGKTVILQVRPTGDFGAQTRRIVKCGSRERIKKEVDNYEGYVADHANEWSTQLQGHEETLHFGGIKYSLLGGSIEETERFLDFYRGVNSAEPVKEVIHHLFDKTCRQWYDIIRSPSGVTLNEHYLELLSLRSDSKQAKMKESMERIETQAASSLQLDRIHRQSNNITFVSSDNTYTFPDPTKFIFSDSDILSRTFVECITHGDMNGNNILVDESRHFAWMIDFERTGFGPSTRDFAELEGVIRWELTRSRNFMELYEFERVLNAPDKLGAAINIPENITDDLRLAIEVILHLRKLAARLTSGDLLEYYAGLLYYGVHMVLLGGITSPGQGRPGLVRRFHALLSSSMICDTLEKRWGDAADTTPDVRIR